MGSNPFQPCSRTARRGVGDILQFRAKVARGVLGGVDRQVLDARLVGGRRADIRSELAGAPRLLDGKIASFLLQPVAAFAE